MANILFIDSGFGGATIIKALQNKYPQVNYIFHCENAFAPLGNKSKEFLVNLSTDIISRYIAQFDIKLVVLACNTLTSACIQVLRKKFSNLNIVGVEPNVKVNSGKTIVIATTYTINNCVILKDKPFVKVSLPKLSYLIDKTYPKTKKCQHYLKCNLAKYSNYSNVVLGCTHYYLVSKELQIIFKKATFYNSIDGVINQICRVYDIKENCEGIQSVFLSKKNKALYKKLVKYLQID